MLNQSSLATLLSGPDRVFLIDQPDLEEDRTNLYLEAKAAATDSQIAFYHIKPDQLTESSLLALWSKKKHPSNVKPGNESNYQLLCERMSMLRRGIVYIAQADLLDTDARYLLSRLIKYATQRDIKWQFLLIAAPDSKNYAKLQALDIDPFYTGNTSNAADKNNLSGSSGDSDTPTRSTKKSKLIFVVPLLLILTAIAGSAYLKWNPLTANQTADQTPNETTPVITNPTSTSSLQPIANETSGEPEEQASDFDKELLEYLDELKQKDQRFEQDLALVKGLAPKTQTEQPQPGTTKPDDQTQDVLNTPSPSQPSETQPATVAQTKIRPPNRLLPANVLGSLTSGDINALQALSNTGETFIGHGQNNESALIVAVLANQPDAINFLLNKNLATEEVDDFGRTALYYAAIRGNMGMITKLIGAGANVNARTDLDKTPVMAAVHNGHIDATKYLLDNGALPDLQDHSGWSALFYATWNDRKELITLLTAKGARDDLRDKDGYSIQDIARISPIKN